MDAISVHTTKRAHPLKGFLVEDRRWQRATGGEQEDLQKFAHQLQRGVLVSLGLDQPIEDLASASTARQR